MICAMFSKLYNLYWFIRAARISKSAKRLLYLHVAEEKRRLIELGADAEELRLICRHLANPRNRFAERNLITYRENMKIGRFSS